MANGKVELRVKNLNIIANWTLKAKNNDCGLCKRKLLAPTKDEIQCGKILGSVIRGNCQHAFHASCERNWSSTGNIICPICRTPWNKDCNLDTKVTVKKLPENPVS